MPSPEPTPAPRTRPWAVPWRHLEAAALLVTALAALVFQLRLPGRFATDDDYRQVAARLEAEARPQDAVLLFPWWTERARLFLPEGLPVVGYLHSEEDPLENHPRIWLLAEPDLPRAKRSHFDEAFLPGRRALGPPVRLGHLELTLFENGRYRPRSFSAVEHFREALVYLDSPGRAPLECPFDGRSFTCPGGAGIHVAPEWHDLFYVPRLCLFMKVPGGATRLVVEFPDVALAPKLVLEGGVIWELAPSRGPTVTTAHVGLERASDGRNVLELAIPPGLEGMQRAEADFPAGAPGERRFRVWVQSDHAEARQLCVDLTSRAGGGP